MGDIKIPKHHFNDAADAMAYAAQAFEKQRSKPEEKQTTYFWDFAKSQRHAKKMANKFLPFIVESSTPVHIFKTLLSRSKGMNRVLIASIFRLTLREDIKKLRLLVKEMPELPLEKIYEELITKYPQYRVNDETLSLYENLVEWVADSDLWTEALDELLHKDILMFFCVTSLEELDIAEYSNIDWSKLLECEEVFSNIQNWVQISDDGVKQTFHTKEQMKSFIMYVAKLLPQISDSTPPVFCFEYEKNEASS